jgi:dolichyl-phosphate beta-glucosyltransferase
MPSQLSHDPAHPSVRGESHPVERELVSFVIPTFREYEVRRSLEDLTAYLRTLGAFDFEVLIVDDSDDQTQAALDVEIGRLQATMPRGITMRLIPGPRLGKGAAVRLGVRSAAGVFVFIVDADLPVPLRHIEEFLERMRARGADVVVGERPRSRYPRLTLRYVLSRGLWMIQRVVVFQGGPFEDTQCGFKAFRAASLRDIVERQVVDRGMYDIEYLYAATRRLLEVHRVAVEGKDEVRPSRINLWRCLLFDPYDIVKIKIGGVFGRYT